MFAVSYLSVEALTRSCLSYLIPDISFHFSEAKRRLWRAASAFLPIFLRLLPHTVRYRDLDLVWKGGARARPDTFQQRVCKTNHAKLSDMVAYTSGSQPLKISLNSTHLS